MQTGGDRFQFHRLLQMMIRKVGFGKEEEEEEGKEKEQKRMLVSSSFVVGLSGREIDE